MGVPISEVGYTSAMHRREDHEVHKDMWGIGLKKKKLTEQQSKFLLHTLQVLYMGNPLWIYKHQHANW